jgi:WD repeat-containing protein 1 (actin-interacting protein 1)
LNYLDPSSPNATRTIRGHQKSINAMGKTSDSKTLFTGSYDGRICAWDVTSGDADIVSDSGGSAIQFTSSEKSTWSVYQDDTLKDIDLSNLSIRYNARIQSNSSGSSGTGSTPKGLTVQNGDIVFLATIKDIQIVQKGKKLVTEPTKYTPSAIAANPAVSGEFAVGAEVSSLPPNLTLGY